MTISQKLCIIIYTFLIIQCAITATVIFVKAKKTGELYSLIACFVAMVLWLYLAMIELMSSSTTQLLINVRLTLFPIMFIGAFWLVFSLYYAGIIKPKNQLKIILLVMLPQVLCVWPLFTDKFFHLVLVSKTLGEYKDVWGVLFYVSTVITYLYVIASVLLILKKTKSNFGNKTKSNLLVIAVSIPLIINFLTGLKLIGEIGFDVTPLSFSVFSIIISIYIFKYRFIEIKPVAVQELFETINEAVFIIDKKGDILEFNKAATQYFSDLIDLKSCIDISSFLGYLRKHSDDVEILNKLLDYSLGDNSCSYEDTIKLYSLLLDTKQYSFCIMPLLSGKREVIGKLLTFKNVTEYRLLTLENERNRLSDDLHDSLGNSINVISSNLEYALENFSDSDEIRECIEVSYEKSAGAFLNLRRIVDELRPIDIENNGFLWALESLFYKLRMKGIHIEFSHNISEDKLLSDKKHGETIYYICQEAINNSVTHGKSNNITITLVYVKSQLNLYITDDGVGCDNIILNKGINSISGRVKSLGGEFIYGSPSDGGFNMKAIFPL